MAENNTTTQTAQQKEEILLNDGWMCSTRLLNAGGWEKDSEWEVFLSRKGVGLTIPYSMGWGHREWCSRHSTTMEAKSSPWAKYFKRGQRISCGMLGWGKRPTKTAEKDFNRFTVPCTPQLADVVYAVLSDAQSVCNGETFEEWAENFGYDTDSRKAEKAYYSCVDYWRGLHRLGVDIEKLSELFQDY